MYCIFIQNNCYKPGSNYTKFGYGYTFCNMFIKHRTVKCNFREQWN